MSEESLFGEAMDEHRGCLELVARVEACLDRRPGDRGAWLSDLREQLHDLTRTLAAHFESEEAGPMFRSLPLRHPRLATRLRSLESEHGTILDQARDAIRRADELVGAELHELRTLNAGVQLLVARIRRHEAAENELMFEANWNEVGVGD